MSNAMLSRPGTVLILNALRDRGSMTTAGIEFATGLSRGASQRYTKALHKAKKVHISSYEREGMSGRRSPVYSFGPGKDAPVPEVQNPPPMTRRPKNDQAIVAPEHGAALAAAVLANPDPITRAFMGIKHHQEIRA